MLRITLAALHLLALGLGMGAVLTRGNTLRETLTADSLRRTFRADNVWGYAAALWLGTGLWRMLGGMEKARQYYEMNYIFMLKMGLFILIFALEIWPMITLIRWRRQMRTGASLESFASVATARKIATLSHTQALILVLMIFAAVSMARGYGLHS
jgi:putative membrane protein